MFSGKSWKSRKVPEVHFLIILSDIPESFVAILNIKMPKQI
jgi:hypothetical protein